MNTRGVNARANGAEDNLERRQSSSCPTTPYTAPNGLSFNIDCNHILPNTPDDHWMETTNQPDLDACMNKCSSYTSNRCYYAAYDPSTAHCLLYNSAFPTSNTTSGGYDIGIARSSQFRTPIDVSCPYTESSIQTLESGERFQILCDVTFDDAAGNYCPDNLARWQCIPHADTLEECMEYCSHAHPLCRGVSWWPGLEPGYANCYLMATPTESRPFVPAAQDYDAVAHSAEVWQSFDSQVDADCPSDHSYTAPGGQNFSIACYDGRAGSENFTSHHENSVGKCIDSCSYSIDRGCVGVVFDISQELGYDNCYLLNDTGSPSKGANAMFAQLVSPHEDASSDQHEGGGSSKAWVTGVVIGILAFLALVAGCVFWWRRRHRRSSHAQAQEIYSSKKKAELGIYNNRAYTAYGWRLEALCRLFGKSNREIENTKIV